MENKRQPRKFFAETREHWPIMSVYERVEQVVAIVLSFVISVVIALALVQLVIRIVPLLLSGAIDPLEHDVFQALFGMIMTLLIAMEFKHSIVRVALRRSSIVQVKTVMLIPPSQGGAVNLLRSNSSWSGWTANQRANATTGAAARRSPRR